MKSPFLVDVFRTKVENDMINFIIGTLFLYILFYLWLKMKPGKKEIDKNKMDFLNQVSRGETAVRLLTSVNVSDIAFIESLLRFYNIPFFMQNYHVCTLRPGSFVKDFNDLFFYILEKDHKDAEKIIKFYFKNKRTDLGVPHKIRNAVEFLLFAWVVPENRFSGNSTLHEK